MSLEKFVKLFVAKYYKTDTKIFFSPLILNRNDNNNNKLLGLLPNRNKKKCNYLIKSLPFSAKI